MCTIAVTRPSWKSAADVARVDRQLAERGEELLGDPRRLLVRDRIGQRHRVRVSVGSGNFGDGT